MPVTPTQARRHLAQMGLSQKAAAAALGVSVMDLWNTLRRPRQMRSQWRLEDLMRLGPVGDGQGRRTARRAQAYAPAMRAERSER
jgi:hypothetical protein